LKTRTWQNFFGIVTGHRDIFIVEHSFKNRDTVVGIDPCRFIYSFIFNDNFATGGSLKWWNFVMSRQAFKETNKQQN